jgi:hypothetical protein
MVAGRRVREFLALSGRNISEKALPERAMHPSKLAFTG